MIFLYAVGHFSIANAGWARTARLIVPRKVETHSTCTPVGRVESQTLLLPTKQWLCGQVVSVPAHPAVGYDYEATDLPAYARHGPHVPTCLLPVDGYRYRLLVPGHIQCIFPIPDMRPKMSILLFAML